MSDPSLNYFGVLTAAPTQYRGPTANSSPALLPGSPLLQIEGPQPAAGVSGGPNQGLQEDRSRVIILTQEGREPTITRDPETGAVLVTNPRAPTLVESLVDAASGLLGAVVTRGRP